MGVRRGLRGRYRLLRPAEREAVGARLRAGATLQEVMAEFGVSHTSARRLRDEVALMRRRVEHSPHRLSFEERERIFVGICEGESDSEIARALGRHRSTIGREIRRCAGERRHYRPLRAERVAELRAARPKPTKLSGCPGLVAAVERGLVQRWSPQQISARLKLDHPDDPRMQISHETIYQSLFVQSRGELRRELSALLRTGRRTRRSRGRVAAGPRIVGMVSIADRPPEVDDRRVPGHWEGDLLVGAGGKSAIVTLVERQTRYVLLAALEDQTTLHVTQVLADRIKQLPDHVVKSLTWDQGRELAAHAQFTSQTDIQVYFCDPHSPWQRGSNENTNGLLRQYLPKGTDLSVHSQGVLDEIAAELNGRPRQTLGWLKPAEKMAELLGEQGVAPSA